MSVHFSCSILYRRNELENTNCVVFFPTFKGGETLNNFRRLNGALLWLFCLHFGLIKFATTTRKNCSSKEGLECSPNFSSRITPASTFHFHFSFQFYYILRFYSPGSGRKPRKLLPGT